MSTTQIVFGTNNITNNWSWDNLWPVQRQQLFFETNCIIWKRTINHRDKPYNVWTCWWFL